MDENALVKQLSVPLYQSRGWLKLLGILSILYGALAAMTIIGILICWLPIWQGILLLRAGNGVEVAQLSGSSEELIKTMNNLRTYFTIMGVLALGGIVATVMAFLITGSSILALLSCGF
jgi:hypothetical protein